MTVTRWLTKRQGRNSDILSFRAHVPPYWKGYDTAMFFTRRYVCHTGLLKVAIECGWVTLARKAKRLRVHWEDDVKGNCRIVVDTHLGAIALLIDGLDKTYLTSPLTTALVGFEYSDAIERHPFKNLPPRVGNLWVEFEW